MNAHGDLKSEPLAKMMVQCLPQSIRHSRQRRGGLKDPGIGTVTGELSLYLEDVS